MLSHTVILLCLVFPSWKVCEGLCTYKHIQFQLETGLSLFALTHCSLPVWKSYQKACVETFVVRKEPSILIGVRRATYKWLQVRRDNILEWMRLLSVIVGSLILVKLAIELDCDSIPVMEKCWIPYRWWKPFDPVWEQTTRRNAGTIECLYIWLDYYWFYWCWKKFIPAVPMNYR